MTEAKKFEFQIQDRFSTPWASQIRIEQMVIEQTLKKKISRFKYIWKQYNDIYSRELETANMQILVCG